MERQHVLLRQARPVATAIEWGVWQMARKVTRRDFLNGTQIAIGASLLNPWAEVFGTDTPKFNLARDYYPPAKTGLRGSHQGSWEIMHARVAGNTWPSGPVEEDFDLIVVGRLRRARQT